MMIPINAAVSILKQALDFTSNIVGRFDDEKYARAVNEIYGYEPNYSELDVLANLIKEATDISTRDKNVLLIAIADKRSELRQKEFEYKKACAQIVDSNNERRAETVLKIIGGILIAVSAGCAAYGVAKGIQGNAGQLRIEPRIPPKRNY